MIKNLRDLSDIAQDAGVNLRRGCLIRSGHLHLAEPEDLIGIASVIDLRTDTEVNQKPDRLNARISYYHIPIFDESAAGITREKNLSYVPDMASLYRLMLESETCRRQLYKVLSVISLHDYSRGGILWHCTAGKDRCGVVSALVLHTLGVDPELILKDYLRSNEVCSPEGDEVYLRLLEKRESVETARAIREIFLAKPEFFHAAEEAYRRDPLPFPNEERFLHVVLRPLCL